ncbi:MAG: class I SAM-dependent methyltransferase [Alphaproteobacteria bacterium]|nr:class I SAM-dependent methyltransferase [Alphaproteobacteria bacterium]
MTSSVNYIPEVRQQYEEFPYPERNPVDEKKRLLLSYLSRMDAVNHHCFKGKQDFRDFRVLVAGGGTGDNLIAWAEQLRGKENSSVVYLDMSETSAGIARKRADIRKLDNITWINDSLLNIPDLNLGQFDFIECNGVLHHLKNPDAGLSALASVLKPEGGMNLMVYAPYGRTGIYQMQNLMRLVNGDEENPRRKIKNTKEILKTLPQYHWFNASKLLGLVAYSDAENDAGIHDLFLHAQDRAFTILEVHDWLERCGLKMASEPGYCYNQLSYMPEQHIKDKNLLTMVQKYPLKIQQAIGEALSVKLTKHEFYAVNKDAVEPVAKITDVDIVPWAGMTSLVSFEQLAAMSQQHRDTFTLTFDKLPSRPMIVVPKGKFVADILRKIDGIRTVAEIVEDIRNHPKYNTPPGKEEILRDFEDLFMSLNRGHAVYLRHKSVEPFISAKELGDRKL